MNFLTIIGKPVVAFVQVVLVLIGLQPVKQHRAMLAGGPVNIMLPGLLGYGEDVGASFAAPYFATLSGTDIADELEALGYESYVPSIGPLSSAWDRACELYAQLTGGRVDYGEAHSALFGHERYGRGYAEPLFEGWGSRRPVNLIGHSFGGTTARVFAMLCDEGSAAEREATPAEDRSPLFDGGLLGGVNAVVTLATPHNGTTADICVTDESAETDYLWMAGVFSLMGNSVLISRIYDLQLDHFHMGAPPRTFGQGRDGWYSLSDALRFLGSRDHALYDLSMDGAAKINEADQIRPGVRYLSYSASLTGEAAGYQVPPASALLNPFLWFYGGQMGLGLGKTSPPGPEWRENDGAVPLPSALHPEGQPHREAPARGAVPPGIWNVMPTVYGVDHAYLAGGDPSRHDTQEILGIYLDMLERIR